MLDSLRDWWWVFATVPALVVIVLAWLKKEENGDKWCIRAGGLLLGGACYGIAALFWSSSAPTQFAGEYVFVSPSSEQVMEGRLDNQILAFEIRRGKFLSGGSAAAAGFSNLPRIFVRDTKALEALGATTVFNRIVQKSDRKVSQIISTLVSVSGVMTEVRYEVDVKWSKRCKVEIADEAVHFYERKGRPCIWEVVNHLDRANYETQINGRSS